MKWWQTPVDTSKIVTASAPHYIISILIAPGPIR